MLHVKEYPLGLGTNSIELPLLARVVGVSAGGPEHGKGEAVRVVVLCDSDAAQTRFRRIAVYRTDGLIPTGASYIGTVTTLSAASYPKPQSLHVFELPPE